MDAIQRSLITADLNLVRAYEQLGTRRTFLIQDTCGATTSRLLWIRHSHASVTSLSYLSSQASRFADRRAISAGVTSARCAAYWHGATMCDCLLCRIAKAGA